MLYEFASDTKVEYLDLEKPSATTIRELVDKYNTPFKLTEVSGNYPTKYCFPLNKNTWIGVYFVYHYKKKGDLAYKMHDTCIPAFFWVKVVTKEVGSYDKLLTLFPHYLGAFPADLDRESTRALGVGLML